MIHFGGDCQTTACGQWAAHDIVVTSKPQDVTCSRCLKTRYYLANLPSAPSPMVAALAAVFARHEHLWPDAPIRRVGSIDQILDKGWTQHRIEVEAHHFSVPFVYTVELDGRVFLEPF